jgi:predicted glycogen debranching enzyme
MIVQQPPCGEYILKWKGDELTVSLKVLNRGKGHAVLRTNLGGSAIRRREIMEETESGKAPLACAWRDIPMNEIASGEFSCTVRLDEVGVFSAKACFFPDGSNIPEWPEGSNFHIKVAPATTRKANSIYTVFPRQFGGALTQNPESQKGVREAREFLQSLNYNVIPPSGTFRDVIGKLDHIMDVMGFRIVQLLPPFPVPTTFARMGDFGCPFAAVDFLSVDPALAEFDKKATPLDQFKELVDAVHAKEGMIFLDLPANHTGWASTLQIHHPDWYRRSANGDFISPGAWGVVWEDLVELDYSSPQLRSYMADVFLFWCRQGVDGFRCDAGYMIPAQTWTYVVAKVRSEFPDTIFMLEGLGGKISVTDSLLNESGLDWAYSEIFQTYDRKAFEWYLPDAIRRAEKYGSLVHFAETHDNDRLAKGGEVYASLRVQLAALLSHQGAWGIANGVEWFATEKIDVHGASSLNWGSPRNMVSLISRLNELLDTHPAFGSDGRVELITRGGGNCLAVLRYCDNGDKDSNVLILANLDCSNGCRVYWDSFKFDADKATNLIAGGEINLDSSCGYELNPGEVVCLGQDKSDKELKREVEIPEGSFVTTWNYPEDARRDVVVPGGTLLRIKAQYRFDVQIVDSDGAVVCVARADGDAVLSIPEYKGEGVWSNRYEVRMTVYEYAGIVHSISQIVVPPPADAAKAKLTVSGDEIRKDKTLKTVLSNGAGADSQINVAWGTISSQYDSLFSANTNPDVPSDRLVLFPRCRIWLQHEGYSRELNVQCIESFIADPAGRFAKWLFSVPCGMGKETAFELKLSYAREKNAVRLKITRLTTDSSDLSHKVSLVLRPDVEWRSFHETTKAYQGAEAAFANPSAYKVYENGFDFSPYNEGSFTLEIKGGEYHHEGLWSYGINHPEEVERMQEPMGDMYSPGWIKCEFLQGDEAVLTGVYTHKGEARVSIDDGEFEYVSTNLEVAPIASVVRNALDLFMVKRDELKTVIAGYPWFLDWGRDTLIFLRGAIAAGKYDDAFKILVEFARFEENGTIPNIIYGETAGNRDTSDAPLWLIVATSDLINAKKRNAKKILSADCNGRKLIDILVSIAENYMKGTPNGIHMDETSSLIWSPSHFTWMDTNYPACTPRVGYPVEIQALWIASLRFLAKYADEKWGVVAQKATRSLLEFFVLPNGGLADCLRAVNGECAKDAVQEDAIRPNQLFALALDVLPESETSLAVSIIKSCEKLVVPGGVRSVANARTECDMSIWDNGRCLVDAHNPYHGYYTGDENTSRKPSYHNGTVWAWPFPMYVEGLVKYSLAAKDTALSILASSVENINTWCLCHISENADGDAPHAQKGCRAQAWSASEFYRVWKLLEGVE